MNLGLDDQGIPVCQPFKSLDEVFKWSHPEFCCNGTKLYAEWKKSGLEDSRIGIECNRPQILICHDMLDGYLDDRFTQGTDNSDAYRFYNWHLIDTFVYFSHKFVTIPPFGWVCAAHQHGVSVLGTIITEWDEGSKSCTQLLQSKEFIDSFVSKLVTIMLFYGFDGWLINIENNIKAEDVALLQYFVLQLKEECHSHLSHAKVLWYDSVVRTGELLWQNELNTDNEMFFDVSDGIFLNYALTEETLERSLVKARQMNRQFDVYAGVDVFGRSTPGGGGFNSKQIVESIMKRGLSCALFAQGWTYEYLGMEDFDANEKKFWQLIDDYLPQRPVSLPISTSFCRGYGKKYNLEGKVVSDHNWHNMSLQQLQLSFPCGAFEFDTDEAFIGGGCLKFSSHDASDIPAVQRLFKIAMEENESVCLSAVWKSDAPKHSYDFGFALVCEGEDPCAVLLMDDCNVDMDKIHILDSVNSAVLTSKRIQQEKTTFLFSDVRPKELNSHWMESSFCFDTNHLLKGVGEKKNVILAVILVPRQIAKMESKQKRFTVSLGHLKLYKQNSCKDFLPPMQLIQSSCLRVEASCPMNQHDVKAIVSHDCFNSEKEVLCLKHPERETSDCRQHCSTCRPIVTVNTKLEHLKLSPDEEFVCSTDTDTERCNAILYFLHWKVSASDSVSVYRLFLKDDTGKEHFIGQSVSNCYIFKQGQNLDICPVQFIIQPVLRNVCLLGHKFVVDLR